MERDETFAPAAVKQAFLSTSPLGWTPYVSPKNPNDPYWWADDDFFESKLSQWHYAINRESLLKPDEVEADQIPDVVPATKM